MKTASESAPETIDVGARVRFKGDYDIVGAPHWMTVVWIGDSQGQRFVTVAYWTKNDAGGPFLAVQSGIGPGAITSKPHEADPPTKKRAR